MMLPALAGAAVLAPVYVPLLFGERWEAAVPLLQLLFVALLPMPFIFIKREL
ncbi:MAG: hypothetical protein GWO24_01635, partial [Akkermansiaceae bacterium]|nr:hypothetical protein [Akkermansiaceae bacterium]NIV19225.1 hypothetical protein [Gammaproteobacteria bacterium]